MGTSYHRIMETCGLLLEACLTEMGDAVIFEGDKKILECANRTQYRGTYVNFFEKMIDERPSLFYAPSENLQQNKKGAVVS